MDLPITIQASTLNNWAAERVAPIYRESKLLGMIQAKGRQKFNQGGKLITWPVKYYRQKIRNVQGSVTSTTFENIADTIHMALPWVGYDMGRSITKFEKLANQGKDVQIYDLLDSVMESLMEDFREDWRLRLWQDGTQSPGELQGVLSVFGGSATPVNGIYNALTSYTPLTTAVTGTNWWALAPAQTYAGQSTVLGTFVNDWASTGGGPTYGLAAGDDAWPSGYYSPSYNVLSPLMIDYNCKLYTPNSAVSSTVHSWQSQR